MEKGERKVIAIYLLRDSEGVVRYVGKTKKPLSVRLSGHLSKARSSEKSHLICWLRSLTSPPSIEIIEWVPPLDWQERECYWIALLRDYGFRLVNGTAGGDGASDPSPEARKNMSEAQRKCKSTPEGRAHCGAANRGRKLSPQWRANIGKSILGARNPNYGKPMSDGQKQLLSARLKGRMAGNRNPMFGKKRPDVSAAMMGEKNPMYGRKKEQNWMYGRTGAAHPGFGKPHSAAHCAKMSAAARGDRNPMSAKNRAARKAAI